MVRMKDGVNSSAGGELEAVVPRQLPALHGLAIDERSVLAALVLHEEFAVLGKQEGVVARDPGIGNRQVLFHLAADAVGGVIEVQGPLLSTMHKNQTGKDA